MRELRVSAQAWPELLQVIAAGLDQFETLNRFGAGLSPFSTLEIQTLLQTDIEDYINAYGQHPWKEEDD